MRLKPGTTNAEARAAAAAFNKRQEAYREQQRQAEMQRRPVDRGPGSGGAPGYNPKTGNFVPLRPSDEGPGSGGAPGFNPRTGNYVPPPLTPEQRRIQGIASTFSREPIFDSKNNITGYKPGGLPPGQINPSRPNVMGFPDMPTQQQLQSGGLGGQPMGVASFGMGRPGGPVNTGGLGQGVASSVNTTTQSDIMGGNRRPMGGFNPGNIMQGLQQLAGRNNPPQTGGRPLTPREVPPFALANQSPQGPTKPMGGLGQGGMSPFNTTTQSDIMGGDRRPPGGFNAGNIMQGLQSVAARNNPQASSPAAPAFKKGGKVTAKAAPVKKAAGGKVAAKAPVKKAMGGKVAAKPMAKPVAKKAKPMAKPMSAMKRGGKVMAKGRYK